MPIVLSVIATVSGYAIFALIQTALVLLMFGSLSEVDGHLYNGYLLQTVTAIVAVMLFWYLYRIGKGFTFDLDKLRFKLEDILLTILIIVFLLGIGVLLLFSNLLLHIVFFVAITAFLLYYSTKKEREDS
ncbi:hypothetical protein D3C73_1044670 [compost metagenome]